MPPEIDPMSALLDPAAWEPESRREEPEAEAEPIEVPAGDEPEDEPAETEEEDEEEGEDEGEEESVDDGEAGDEPEPSEEEVEAVGDPEIAAFLAKYGGDTEKALKGAAELARLTGRQGRDLTEALQQVAQLQAALLEAQTVSAGLGMPLNEQQKEWVEQAAGSANPAMFAQQAVQQGQFELARAVCREWALSNPYEALRVGQWVDATEVSAYQAAVEPRPVSTDEVIAALDQNMPEMRPYYGQMAQIVAQLGDNHPLVMESRSSNAEEAIRGMVGLYEIARASVATVQDAQAGEKKRRRKDADDVRANGRVSSGGNSPSRGAETPRDRLLMPGLTQAALDTEFAAQAGR
jgi:hypothetical protein